MSVKFCTIASGSSGNCVFIDGGAKILIDAGLSGAAIAAGLSAINEDPLQLSAIFITHEHGDHISGAGIMSRRYGVPLFMTPGTWQILKKQKTIGNIRQEKLNLISPGAIASFNDMQVLPFAVSHDAAEPVGYTISTSGRKIAIATDLGHTDDQIAEHFHGADIILLESNHDLDMLKFGNYPAHLKRRILSDIGHLSNPAAGIFLRDIYSPKTKHIFLAHLSEENNRPILAHETVQNILLSAKIPIGTDCGLYLAPRKHISPVIELE